MGEQDRCTWPLGTCSCYAERTKANEGADRTGRVWMHCEQGLNLSKASMGRFLNFCLSEGIEIGSVAAFAPEFPRCQVSATVRLRPSQFEAFEAQTGGVLRKPPMIKLN